METWYRYHDVCYADPLNEYDEPVGTGRHSIELTEFVVKKHTPKGVWIGWAWSDTPKRFVLHAARKKFAHPTKREAMLSFIERKKRQHGIYQSRANTAAYFLEMAKQQLQTL